MHALPKARRSSLMHVVRRIRTISLFNGGRSMVKPGVGWGRAFSDRQRARGVAERRLRHRVAKSMARQRATMEMRMAGGARRESQPDSRGVQIGRRLAGKARGDVLRRKAPEARTKEL